MLFFTADLHLGHGAIMKFARRLEFMTDADRDALRDIEASGSAERFKRWKPAPGSVARMDEALLARINAAVPVEGTLWILGDFARPDAKPRGRLIRAYREAIRCRDVHLIWGNHDHRHLCEGLFASTREACKLFVHPDEPRGVVEADLWGSDAGRDRRDALRRDPRTRSVFLSHYPHVVWHHSDRGAYHLYGHTHGNLEAWRDAALPGALSLDAGVDCWGYAPVAFDRVDAALTERRARVPPHTIDHARRPADGGPA